MLEQGDLTGAEALFVESAPHAVSETGARQIAELARSRYARARLLALAAVTVGLGAARLASAWSTRRISLPLPRISAGLPRTIRGDEESAATLPRRADDIDILRHVATDRAIFARGALKAALWGQDKAPGQYDMVDVLGL